MTSGSGLPLPRYQPPELPDFAKRVVDVTYGDSHRRGVQQPEDRLRSPARAHERAQPAAAFTQERSGVAPSDAGGAEWSVPRPVQPWPAAVTAQAPSEQVRALPQSEPTPAQVPLPQVATAVTQPTSGLMHEATAQTERRRSLPVSAVVAVGVVVIATAVVVDRGVGDAHPFAALATGLTAGGLSCLAVQAGLLASALKPDSTSGRVPAPAATIGLFLVAKVVAYTLLGGLLGYFGSLFQLGIGTRGILQLIIGVFMIGTAARMLYPHPWLRWLVLEPPASVRRGIRRVSKSSDSQATPLFLGAMTVMIPCGVTQAMMAMALATGSIAAGALTMFMFTLGTVPLFFGLSYAATSLGKRRQRQFNVAVALLLIVLGGLAINGGLRMTGHAVPGLSGAGRAEPAATAQPSSMGGQEIAIAVRDKGYSPDTIGAASDTETHLMLKTDEITGCTSTFAIPELKIEKVLKSTGTTMVVLPPHAAGDLQFTCGMGMYHGTITFTKDEGANKASMAGGKPMPSEGSGSGRTPKGDGSSASPQLPAQPRAQEMSGMNMDGM